ncbi:MAG: hypothetical protein J3T61_12675, partial [Candidatus Brocadiales bacterium]|nr:hypothetical protein [Candidatus Bathyanammoxibius sp.]
GATANPVTVIDGVFSVILGKSTPFTGIENPPVELGIKIEADPEMTPRIELTSVIYALHADRSDSSEYAQKAGEVSGTDNVFPGSGNVGIGTTSPGEKLEISLGAGSGNIASFSAVNNTRFLISVDGVDSDLSAQAGNNLKLGTSFSGTSLTVLNSSGNVGIGTANPLQKLHVKANSGDSEIRIEGSSVGVASTARVSFYNSTPTRIGYIGDASSGTDDILIVADANNAFQFYTGGQNRLHITNTGNVGIGTTSPGTPLHIMGTTAGGAAQRDDFLTLHQKTTVGQMVDGLGVGMTFMVEDVDNVANEIAVIYVTRDGADNGGK